MKVIILAAGRGTRISKQIGDIPKCTVDVGGKPLICHTIEMLNNNGVKNVSIVLGYKHSFVSNVLKNLSVKEFFNPFFQVTNSLGSLWFAKQMLDDDEDIIICNGDVFWTKELFELIKNSKQDIVMLADKTRADDGDYFFKTENNILVNFGKDLERNNRDCEYVGIAKISKNAVLDFRKNIDKMIEHQEYDKWWENALYSMIGEKEIFVQDVQNTFWAEVDFIEDYKRILSYIETNKNN